MLPLLLLATALAQPPADLSTTGVVLSPVEGRRVALLRSGGRTRQAGIGDIAFGGRVITIAADGVTLEFGSGRIVVPLTAGREAASLVRPGPTPRPSSNAGLTFERREVERRLSEEIPRILAETSLVPVNGEGGTQGYALARIPPGTLLSDAGLQAGDVITRINDVPIDSMATLIGLWPRLQGASDIQAIVLRGGQPITLTVSLR